MSHLVSAALFLTALLWLGGVALTFAMVATGQWPWTTVLVVLATGVAWSMTLKRIER
jgi:hypothetical protein